MIYYPSTRIRLARYAAMIAKERAKSLGCTEWQAHCLARRAAILTRHCSPEMAIDIINARINAHIKSGGRHV